MVQRIQPMVSVARVHDKWRDVLAQMATEGPLIVANAATPVCVMVPPATWDQMVQRIENLTDLVDGLRAELEIERGEVVLEDIDIDQLRAQAGYVPA